jgi:integrase
MKTKHEPITEFIDNYQNEKTKNNYLTSLSHFLKFVSYTNQTGEYSDINKLAKRYLQKIRIGKHDYKKDLGAFASWLSKKYASTTANLYLRSTIMWLTDNGYTINRRELQRIYTRLPKPIPIENGIELKRKVFRELYYYFPEDVQTLLLVMLASGMRLGEALLLNIDDVIWNKERAEIHIRAEITKTKKARTAYLTAEACESLIEYLNGRMDSCEKLFTISYSRAQAVMLNASENLGYSKIINGRNRGMHWHMTRKWFISRFTLAANKDVAEFIAGHE